MLEIFFQPSPNVPATFQLKVTPPLIASDMHFQARERLSDPHLNGSVLILLTVHFNRRGDDVHSAVTWLKVRI